MRLGSAIGTILLLSACVCADQSAWTGPDAGDWLNDANWSSGTPNSSSDTAVFGPQRPALAAAINLDSAVTVAGITVTADKGIRLAGDGSLVFAGDLRRLQLDAGAMLDVRLPSSFPGANQVEVWTGANARLVSRRVISLPEAIVRKHGPGVWQVSAANVDWGGSLVIEEGQVELTDSLSLGANNRTTVLSGATLSLARNVSLFNESLSLDGGSLLAGRNTEVLNPIEIDSESSIVATNDLALLGPINGSGSIRYEGGLIEVAGRLAGGNRYEGHTWIDQGRVKILSDRSLGTSTGTAADGTTLGPDGVLSVGQNVTLSGELLTFDGGRLRFEPATLGAIDTPLFFAQDGHIDSRVDSLQVGGVWNGPGGVQIEQADGRVTLNNQGDYAGTTVLRASEVMVRSPQSLGDRVGPTVVETGLLWITETGPSGEPLIARPGTIVFIEPPTYEGSITLQRATLEPVHDRLDVSVIEAIVVEQSGIIDSGSTRLRLLGGITGTGDVVLSGGEPIEISDPLTIDGTLVVEGEVVLKSPQHFRNRVLLDNGRLAAEVDVEFDELSVGTDRGRLSSVGDAVITIHNFDPANAIWDLNLNSQQPVVIDHPSGPTLQNLGTSFAQEIVVRRGELVVAGPTGLGNTVAGTRVDSFDGATIALNPGIEIAESIDLNNAIGIGGHGALVAQQVRNQNDTTPIKLLGALDLGDVGAVIGGSEHPQLHIEGTIEGGTLTKRGMSHLVIATSDAQYTGETRLLEGTTTLIDEGRLESTSRIVIEGRYTQLRLDDLGSVSDNDRIADNIPIVMRGGRIEALSPPGTTTSENLGPVHLQSGFSAIANRAFDWGKDGDPMRLNVQSLAREPGAVVDLGSHNDGLSISAPVELEHGIIGGWARVGGGQFATVVGDQVRGMEDNSENLNDPTIGNHVFQRNSVTLDADRQPATISINSGIDVDLNEHTLNVLTGGASLRSRPTIFNGRLTAGTAADAELFLYGDAVVGASIVDNEQGRVNLVVTGVDNRGRTGTIFLSGQNTYSGSTTVHSDLSIQEPQALPTGTDLDVDRGHVRLVDGRYQVGQVRLRNQGSIFGGEQVRMHATSWQIESGSLTGIMAGDAPLSKTTSGVLQLDGDHGDFDGTISIREGVAAAFHPRALGTGQTIVHEGARLGAGASLVGSVVLDGGQLFPLSAQRREVSDASFDRIDVRADSRIILRDLLGDEGIRGADLRVSGSLRGTGDLLIDGPDGTDLIFAGDNSDYSGEMTIAGAEVTLLHSQGLANHRTTVAHHGVLGLQADQPIPGHINLNAGTLKSGFVADTHFAGNLEVRGESLVTGNALQLSGRVALHADAHLIKSGDRPLQVTGALAVGRAATVEVKEGRLELLGTVMSTGSESGLNIRSNDDQLRLDTSVEVAAGATLRLTQRGEPLSISFDAADEVLSGGGTLESHVLVAADGRVAPGPGAAELTVDGDLGLNGGALQWDVQSAENNAGRWDRVVVRGNVSFGTSPTTVRVTGIDDEGVAGPIRGFDPLVDYEWPFVQGQIMGFADAQMLVDASNLNTSYPLTRHAQMRVVANDTQLTLVYDANESLGDFNADGLLDAEDIDLLSAAIRDGSRDASLDMNLNGRIESGDRVVWVEQIRRTYFGDSNLDGIFGSADLVQVFERGEYEDGIARNSTWASGDWNGDADFTSGDLVTAFQGGGYESGPRVINQVVPEPSTIAPVMLIVAWCCDWRRRRMTSGSELYPS